ncbi:hypothetical protein Tco_0294808 [Tanacetum coccineum]
MRSLSRLHWLLKEVIVDDVLDIVLILGSLCKTCAGDTATPPRVYVASESAKGARYNQPLRQLNAKKSPFNADDDMASYDCSKVLTRSAFRKFSQPLNKEFNAFKHSGESRKVLVCLQKELSKVIEQDGGKISQAKSGEQQSEDAHMANVQGEQSTAQETTTTILVEDTLKQKDSDDEPPIKKLKFLIPTSSIPSPTPLNSIPPEPIPRTEISKMSFDQFSEHLTQTTSSIFSPTPPREPTPPRNESKVKGIATEEPLKDIMPYIEEGGYVPKMPKFKSFITLDEQLTQEDIIAQVKEMKRLADLKSEKEKLEESLKRMADELPITKINCKVSSSNDATMRITRGNDPLNVVIHDKFRLKTLRFSEWLEVHALASKTKSKSNDQLPKNLKAKF